MKLSGTESVALGRKTDAASALSHITSITTRSARQQQGIEAVGIGLLEQQLHREGALQIPVLCNPVDLAKCW